MPPTSHDRIREALARARHVTELSAGHGIAAVAVILRATDVLLIRRARHPDDPWSGHMAFPGGRHDPGDQEPVDTAVRETLEEVGIDLRLHARLLGSLQPVPAIPRGARAGLTVHPFVFSALPTIPDPRPNYEVDRVVWASIPLLRSDETATTMKYTHEGRELALPGLKVGEDTVWGITLHMLRSFFAVLDTITAHEDEPSCPAHDTDQA